MAGVEGSSPGQSTPAGWYPDPSGTAQQRYWDGSEWSEHYAPAAPQQAPPPPQAAPPQAPPQQAPPQQAPVPQAPPPAAYPVGTPPKQGMSGCLKAFLIGVVILFIGGCAAAAGLLYVGGRVVHHLAVTAVPVAGRPSSMPSGAAAYNTMRKQDHVAGADGAASLGSISATATNWARTTSPTGTNLICGDVTIRRAAVNVSNDPFGAALQAAGDLLWELETPGGQSVAIDDQSSSLSVLNDYLRANTTGDASGKVCFADPGGSGQFAVTWQPRVLNAQRMVWIVHLS